MCTADTETWFMAEMAIAEPGRNFKLPAKITPEACLKRVPWLQPPRLRPISLLTLSLLTLLESNFPGNSLWT